MCEIAERDVVPILARQADVIYEDRAWLKASSVVPTSRSRSARSTVAICATWPLARRRHWLRAKLC